MADSSDIDSASGYNDDDYHGDDYDVTSSDQQQYSKGFVILGIVLGIVFLLLLTFVIAICIRCIRADNTRFYARQIDNIPDTPEVTDQATGPYTISTDPSQKELPPDKTVPDFYAALAKRMARRYVQSCEPPRYDNVVIPPPYQTLEETYQPPAYHTVYPQDN